MVIVSILPHAEFGPNDDREDTRHFIIYTCSRKYWIACKRTSTLAAIIVWWILWFSWLFFSRWYLHFKYRSSIEPRSCQLILWNIRSIWNLFVYSFRKLWLIQRIWYYFLSRILIQIFWKITQLWFSLVHISRINISIYSWILWIIWINSCWCWFQCNCTACSWSIKIMISPGVFVDTLSFVRWGAGGAGAAGATGICFIDRLTNLLIICPNFCFCFGYFSRFSTKFFRLWSFTNLWFMNWIKWSRNNGVRS